MRPLNIFFPTENLRDDYIKKVFKMNDEEYLEGPMYLRDMGIENIEFKNQYKKIPGFWVCIGCKDKTSKERIASIVEQNIPSFWLEEGVFFPSEMTAQRKMEELWIQKYNLDEEHNGSKAWTIFFRELKRHYQQENMDVARIGILCIYKRNPYFLKKCRRYYLFEDLAYYFEAKGELHKSIKCLKIQASLQPDSSEPYLNMSSFLLLNGFNEEAIDVCKRGLEINATDEYLSNNLLIAYFNGEYYETAMGYLKKHLINKPEDPVAWKMMADIFYQTGKNNSAIDCYHKVLAMESDDAQEVVADVYYGLGVCYQQLGNRKEAIKYYRKLLKYNPGDPAALLNLSKLYGSDLGKYNLAEIYAQRFIRLYPQNGYGYHNLGLIYLSTDSFDKAKWYLYKARKLIPYYQPVHDAIIELKREKKKDFMG